MIRRVLTNNALLRTSSTHHAINTSANNMFSTNIITQTVMKMIQLPDLAYAYDALEPVLSGEIMDLHHRKHHQTYVKNFNEGLEKLHEAVEKRDLKSMIELEKVITFNGGGHENHSMFWQCLTPKKDFQEPKGRLIEMIDRDFQSFEKMKARFAQRTVAVQGSGWGWLCLNKETNQLLIATTQNQDPCYTLNANYVPIFGVDVWEHAYYLQYKNVRPDYVNKIFDIVNWKQVEENLMKALI